MWQCALQCAEPGYGCRPENSSRALFSLSAWLLSAAWPYASMAGEQDVLRDLARYVLSAASGDDGKCPQASALSGRGKTVLSRGIRA